MAVTHLVDGSHPTPVASGAGDKVRIKGREGLYLVLRHDGTAGTADVVSCGPGLHVVERGIPLPLVQQGYDYLPELFRWYVEAAPVR